jgi:ADP-ribose pyrophosphatase YjhB (NUDIX family)/ketosteroid isomerase-like protein
VTVRDPFDLVREWFTAYNRGDLAALGSYYADGASLEHEDGRADGREGIDVAWLARFRAWGPGYDGGHRRRVRMVARIETGLIHAEWLEKEADGTGAVRERRGYSDFRIERGAILSQQDVFYEGSGDPEIVAGTPPLPPRKYPPRPVVGVGAVIAHDDRVVLIKRKYEPMAGQWSLPGGTLELGESLEAGVAREIREETGLDVEVGPVVEVFDRILLDAEGRVQYHFVLVDYLCRPIGGHLQSGSDVDDAVWVAPSDLPTYYVTPKATAVVERALSMVPDAFA